MVTSNTKIQVLKFADGPDGGGFVRSILDCSTADDLCSFREKNSPVVYVLPVDDLSNIRRFTPPVIYRGRKNEHKGLSEYLLGLKKDSIPAIDGNYGSATQPERGVRAFYSNAHARREHNLFIVGVRTDIFKELWEKAEKADKPADKSKIEVANTRFTDGRQCLSPPCKLFELEVEDQAKLDRLAKVYIGCSRDAEDVRSKILRAGNNNYPILIVGDMGTGKEVISQAIHDFGNRAGKEFIALNCSSIPKHLFELELFGCEGNVLQNQPKKKGAWQDAEGGTLFLDEIGEMRLDHQAKLLRALSVDKIRPIGAKKEIDVTARVIAATNRNLFSMVETEHFREDLYHRLRVFVIETKPLRSHPEDIPLLAEFSWRKLLGTNYKPLPDNIIDKLKSYLWPGNVRELDSVLKSLFANFPKTSVKGCLSAAHLDQVFFWLGQSPVIASKTAKDSEFSMYRAECLRHLKRANEVVHAVRATVLPATDVKKFSRPVEAVAMALELRFGELDDLCKEPSFFYSESTFSTVYRLIGKLKYFQDLLREDLEKAVRYWSKDVTEEIKVVMSTIFKEIEIVTAKA